jgi:two-component system, NtrC family, sensor kinase
VLNSVRVSADTVQGKLNESKVYSLQQAVRLMTEHADNLGHFLSADEKGQRLPGYLAKLADTLTQEKQAMKGELAALIRNFDHIEKIVAAQQSWAGTTSHAEPVQLDELVGDAVRLSEAATGQSGIRVVQDLPPIPPLLLDKHLLLQILVHLLSNARQAMDNVSNRHHEVTIDAEVFPDRRRLRIRVQDNGEGIISENVPKLFAHGFTTRKNGYGFGLHVSAIAAKTLGGSLTAQSDGLGRGAVFTLELPLSVAPATQLSRAASN